MQLNVIIIIPNSHKDDWNLETSKDPWLHYLNYQISLYFLSLSNNDTSLK